MFRVESEQSQRPTPELFDDYRAYLKAMIAYLKRTQRRFSYRYFSKLAGYSSPNFLKLVADGQRQLSVDSIGRFAQALGLDEREREQFEALVLLGQSKTDAERNRYYARLRRTATTASPATQLEKAQYDVYAVWYALPIRDLIAQPDFVEDPEWIARRMHPRIKASEAKRALALLEQTGLATREASGRLVVGSSKLSTPPTVRSLSVRNYHRAMLQIAAQALDGLPVEDRDVTSVTVAMSKEQFELVRQRIAAFREDLLNLIEDAPVSEGGREVYVLGFQSVPVTRKDVP